MDFLDGFKSLNLIEIIIGVFILISLIKDVISFIDFYKKRFNIKTNADAIEHRIRRLENHDELQYKTLNDISHTIDSMREEEKANTVVLYGFLLNSFYDKIKEQNYISKEQYETFNSMAEIYLAKDGDHLIKERVIPLINSMEIR